MDLILSPKVVAGLRKWAERPGIHLSVFRRTLGGGVTLMLIRTDTHNLLREVGKKSRKKALTLRINLCM